MNRIRRSFRPAVDALEGRQMLSVAVSSPPPVISPDVATAISFKNMHPPVLGVQACEIHRAELLHRRHGLELYGNGSGIYSPPTVIPKPMLSRSTRPIT